MSNKLFKVEITTNIFVIAKNENDAIDIALDNIDDEKQSSSPFAQEINDISEIDKDWLDSLPYTYRRCNDAEVTCKEFIEGQNEDSKED